MNGDQAGKVVEAIEVLILARLGKPTQYVIAPDELGGSELNALFDAREDLRLVLVYGD